MTHVKTTLSHLGEYTIYLNRPEKHHAFNVAMLAELTQVFSQAFDDNAVKVIVLRSSGKVFCAGADLGDMRNKTDHLIAQMIAMLKVLRNKNKPILSALMGDVYGGGSLLLGFCDVIVASEAVSIVMPEIKSSLWPVFLMHILKPHLPQTTLMHMAMTAEPLSASRSYELGWFSDVVADEVQVNAKILTIVSSYCQHSKTTLRCCYQSYQDDFKLMLSDETLDRLGRQLSELVRSGKTSVT